MLFLKLLPVKAGQSVGAGLLNTFSDVAHKMFWTGG